MLFDRPGAAGMIAPLAGGMLIGAGAAVLLLLNGKIAGISGVLDNAVRGVFGSQGWRLGFLLGLMLPAAVFGLGPVSIDATLPLLAASGLLVGFGTRLGSGCTSGHGVCGLANLSPRSVVATGTFMLVAVATVYVVRHGAMRWHS
jgi:uncharacterized membrane protein YedE/YeeE